MKLCICGNERSGTTAVARIIAKASGMSLLLDPPEAYQACFEMNLRGKLNPTLDKMVCEHDIVKVPNFAAVLLRLRNVYGSFPVLFMLRDPRDVVCSIMERVRGGPWVDHMPIFWTPPSTGVIAADRIEGICQRWCEFVDGGLNYKSNGQPLYFLDYADWYEDKLGTLQEACRSLGVKFYSSLVTETDLTRQHNKYMPGKPNPVIGPGRWQKELTEPDQKKVMQMCKPMMRAVYMLPPDEAVT